MKTAKWLGVVEQKAGAQVTRLVKAARKRYDRLTRSTTRITNPRQQRRYIRAARQTISSAEKIIAQLKRRVAAVEKALGTRRRARPVKRNARRAQPRRKTRR